MNPPKTTEDEPVLFYEGPHYYLSNFSAFAVEWGRRLWMTSEHAYQGAKFLLENRQVANLIQEARSAHDAKRIARAHEGEISGWSEELRLSTMREIVECKLRQHPWIQKMLLKTGERTLVEDSHKDAFWGRGPDGDGRNELGKIWMDLRAKLRAKPAA